MSKLIQKSKRILLNGTKYHLPTGSTPFPINYILAGTSPNGFILKSSNLGQFWINEGSIGQGNPTVFCKLPNGDILYGTDTGKLVNRTKNTSATVASSAITSIAFDNTSIPVTIKLGTLSGDIFSSIDGGNYFVNEGTFPSIYALVFNSNYLIFTEGGIYSYPGTLLQTGNFTCACDAGDGFIYAGTHDGHIWRNTTQNNYEIWQDLGRVLVEYDESSINVIIYNSGRFIFSFGGGVAITDDNFDNCTLIDGYGTCLSLVVVDDLLFRGDGDGRVYKSADNGLNWTDLGQQFLQTSINCLISYTT